MNQFSKREALSFAWQKFRSDWKFFVVLMIIVGFISWAPNFLMGIFSGDLQILGRVLALICWIFGLIVSIGVFKIYLLKIDDKEANFSMLFSSYRLFFRYILGYVVNNLIATSVLILGTIPGLIIVFILNKLPGLAKADLSVIGLVIVFLFLLGAGILDIIVTVKLQFWSWIMVDQNSGVIDSLRKSWKITEGTNINLLLLSLILSLINILGVLALVMGLLVTVPVTTLATAYVYRQLEKQSV